MTQITKRLNIALLAGLVAASLSIPHAMAEDRGGRGGPKGGNKGGDRGAKVFARVDTNEDGVLSLAEMTAKTAGKAAKMLARKDGDEDGVLSLAEFQSNRHGNAVDLTAIAADIVQCVSDLKDETGDADIVVPTADSFVSPEARFNAADTSGDGSLDLTELEAGALAKATNGFNNMDADADGSVTKEEFDAAHKSQRATKKAVRQCVHEINDSAAV
jgi:Ca2+-binding EF-hand superfamily protein